MMNEDLQTIQSFRATDIYDPTRLTELKSAAFNLIDYADRSDAAAFARALETLLRDLQPRDNAEAQAYRVARYWLLRLKVFGFSALSLPEQVRLIREDIGGALSYGFLIGEEVARHLDFYSTEAGREFARAYAGALRENQATLGQGAGKKTLGAWITEYQKSLGIRPLPMLVPGTVDLLNFINTSSEVKLLNEGERELLRGLVTLYNSLLALRPFAESPTLTPPARMVENTASYPYPIFPPPASVKRAVPPPVVRPPSPTLPTRGREREATPTIAPVELRDESREGYSSLQATSYQPQARSLPPAPRPHNSSQPPLASRGGAAPSLNIREGSPPHPTSERVEAGSELSDQKGVDEELYRSTLEELQKMRMDYEKAPSRPISGIPSRRVPIAPVKAPQPPSAQAPKPQIIEIMNKGESFSVNEAVASGQPQFGGAFGKTGIAPGQAIIEDKLKKLEERSE